MSWEERSIDSITEIVTKGTTPSTYGYDFIKEGINYIRAEAISKDGRVKENTFLKISSECHEKLKRSQLKFDDILFSIAGMALGKTGIVKENYLPANTNQAVAIIRPIKELINPRFLQFQFINPNFYELVNKFSAQAAQPNINLTQLKSLSILTPPLQTQKRIADILSAYNDLIENNLKRIKLLEQAAQNIYKEWFVHLRFPGHENTPVNEDTGLPEGWEEVEMEYFYSEYIGGGWGKENLQKGYNKKAHVIRGTDFNKIKSGSFDSTPLRFHKESNLSSRKLEKGDLILEVSNGNLSKVGDIFLITDDVFKVLDTDIICASFCKMLRPKTLDKSFFIYHYIIEMNISNLMLQYKNESAAGINNFNFTSFLSKEIVELPSQQLLSGFYNVVNPIHEQISHLRHQIQKLKAARDILLPRLMNRTIEA